MRSALASAFVDSLPSAFLFMINSGYLGRWGKAGRWGRVGKDKAPAPRTHNNN